MSKGNIFPGQPIIGKIFNLIDIASVNRAARRCQADHYCKSFMTLDHLYTMIFALMSNCTTIREVETGFCGARNRLGQIGMKKPPAKSTISDANARRESKVFAMIYHLTVERYSNILPDSRENKDLIARAKIIDSTTVQLFNDILETTGRKPLSGKSKGGMKAHTMLDAAAGIPRCVYFSDAKAHDSKFMGKMELLKGDIAVFDKGYVNYTQYQKWTEEGIYFVTREKDNAQYKVIERRNIAKNARGKVKTDQLITVAIPHSKETMVVRRVKYKDPDSGRTFVYWTNLLYISALNVAAFYKYRWKIENFFKQIKQNFNLKYFLGESQNAIEIQIWACLILNLLYRILLRQAKRKWAFSNFCSFVRIHLWTYIHLTDFLNDTVAEMKKKLQIIPQAPDLFSG